MAIQVYVSPAQCLYLRDPQSTELGKQILQHGIELLDSLGQEDFTFRKLATHVGCTEASVYRYFANKHQLLVYLISWYWDWVHYLIARAADEHSDALAKLNAAIKALTSPMIPNPAVPYIDESILHRIVILEGSKAYHSKDTDEQNKAGAFLPYKELVETLAELISKVSDSFQYPRALASSLFDMSHNHIYYAQHLPRLTEVLEDGTEHHQIDKMLQFWVNRLLQLE